ncbi:MAG: phosphoenolpyruvate--protein phosphotransferase [Planctomycetota bacterium]|jgi:phosphoenolpyruvate-protein phosphotransferase|nr:phosphoenolpyruvate--protein phosphotransferase [Planctomycetota bacterium]MDP6761692.1 phosphoenolpyruvate--protein phosphotransferase [Planctomycetota bacterium]MDP6990194.1 phosphoenolpyruvate--protein phosphotransferase [Planctomycetota bacterium]
MSEGPAPAAAAPAGGAAEEGAILEGTPVAPGLAVGEIYRKDQDLQRAAAQRVPPDAVERELNRFHEALRESRAQLEGLKLHLEGKVSADHVRILDTHLAYLKDTVFLSDVENLILNEQMSLEAAIAKVVADFDRIFRLVENSVLRERAVDLRDIGIRVLRNLGGAEGAEEPAPRERSRARDYIIAARELSIVDMFNLENDHVLGIVTETGGVTSHAAILARSMGIPTVTGVEGLLARVGDGESALLDASEGVLRMAPTEALLAQYRDTSPPANPSPPVIGEWAGEELSCADGTRVVLTASCGNLPEVSSALSVGVGSVGLYRTELMHFVGSEPPSIESLVAHYRAVIEEAQGGAVTFRLLHADSGLGLAYLHEHREANPALGLAGVRALLAREDVLRAQLAACLRVAGDSGQVRIAVPFVTDRAELLRVADLLAEESARLRRAGALFGTELELGAVIEVPLAALAASELAAAGDFLMVSFDALSQFVMAADRHGHALDHYFDVAHPAMLRLVREVVRSAARERRPLSMFGVGAVSPAHLPLLVGLGVEEFCVAPADLPGLAERVQSLDAHRARDLARRAMEAGGRDEVLDLLRR